MVKKKLTSFQSRHLKMSLENRERERRRYHEILNKNAPLEISDVLDFFDGLPLFCKNVAGGLFVGRCAIDGMTPLQILDRLTPEEREP